MIIISLPPHTSERLPALHHGAQSDSEAAENHRNFMRVRSEDMGPKSWQFWDSIYISGAHSDPILIFLFLVIFAFFVYFLTL